MSSTASGAPSSSTSLSLFALVPERILYRDVITFPPVRQDLAFVVDETLPAGELIAAAREAAGDDLREARFLSDYRGDPIPDGKKSVAFSVAFQSAERTLTDEDAVAAAGGDRRGGREAVRRRAPRRLNPQPCHEFVTLPREG